MLQTKLIATWGLTADEISIIKRNLPQKECEVMDTDDARDIIATHEFATIVKVDVMKQADVDMLIDFYSEIAPFSESVILIGKIQVPDALSRHIAVYADFDELKEKIKGNTDLIYISFLIWGIIL